MIRLQRGGSLLGLTKQEMDECRDECTLALMGNVFGDMETLLRALSVMCFVLVVGVLGLGLWILSWVMG